ncbi:MAG: arginase family protein [DPANN group archaeon]|nr:arginase family protein [DPANN group archaeon]
MIIDSVPKIDAMHIRSYYDEKNNNNNLFTRSLEEEISRTITAIKTDKNIEFITKQNIPNILDKTKEFCNKLNKKPLYLSIDVDVFKEVNASKIGLTSLTYGTIDVNHFETIFDTILQNANICGIDITEVNTLDPKSIDCGNIVLSTILEKLT